MNNGRGKNVRHSSSTLQMHNFMPMPSPSPALHVHPDQREGRASFENQLKLNMQCFWKERLSEICEAPTDVRAQHTLPLARIKKVMKSDDKVKMISADTPVLFAKACEIFAMELSLRAWMHTQHHKRKTVQRDDIALAIRDEHLLAFLTGMVPMEMEHHCQGADVSNCNDENGGVYVPRPLMPNDYWQTMNNDPGFSGSNGGMQYNPSFHPPSFSNDGANPYISFKEFFQ